MSLVSTCQLHWGVKFWCELKVSMSENIGVPGGRLAGVRNIVSKLKSRIGGLYTTVQHLYVPVAYSEKYG